MKKTAIVLMCILVLSMFAGCGGGLEPDQVMSVRNRNNGKVVNMGDTREYVNQITGNDEAIIGEFDDGVVRCIYWNAYGMAVDYLDDKVVAITLNEEKTWETYEKVYIGMDEQKVRDLFADNPNAEEGLSGGLMIGYDKDNKEMKFSDKPPYYKVISFEEGKVSTVILQDDFEEVE